MSRTSRVEDITFGSEDEGQDDQYTSIRARIMFVMRIYPRLSASMIQVGIGPHTKPDIWRPILEEMVEEGVLIRKYIPTTTPKGTYRTVSVLELRPEHVRLIDVQPSQIDSRQFTYIQDSDPSPGEEIEGYQSDLDP